VRASALTRSAGDSLPFETEQLHAINQAMTVFLETGDWRAASAVLVAAASRQTASELEERYRRLVESCPDAIAVHSGRELVFVNPAGLRLVGAERPEDVLGRPILDFVHPDCRQQVVRRLERLQSGQPVPLVAEKFVRLDGSTVDVEAAAIPFTYRGRPAVQVVIRDLTERKRGENLQAALFQISEATSSVQDMTAFYAAVHSIVGQLMYAGNFYVALHDEATGLLSFPYFVDEVDSPPDPIPPGQTLTGYVLRTGEPLLASPDVFADLVERGEVQSIGAASADWLGVPLKEGTRAFGVLAVQSYGEGRRFSDAEKELLTFVSQQVATAITRKRAEEALRRSEQRYHSLAVLSPVGLFQTDSAGRCLYVNERWCEMTGLDTQTAMGEGWAGALHPQDRERVFDEWRRATEAGLGFKSEYRFRRPDGGVTWVLGHSAAQRDPAGHVIGHVGTITDVTERKGLEEQLRQSQKIEAVGQLAGGVAHDFNNLLSVITGYGELLVRGLGPQDPLQRKAEQVLKAAQRAAGLTQQLLAFSRKQVLTPKILDLNLVVADMEEMLKRLIREDITLATRLAPALGTMKVDPTQIEQVIVNLAVNARDAMAEGGTLTIETRSVYLDHGYARSHPGASTGPHVLLTVADTGHGMDGETLARIFEPFFTTKGAGKGTGLGLSTVYGIVKQSGGYISVESEVGSGTRFEIYLPQVETIAEAFRPTEARPAGSPGSETILLVEDADAVREVSRELLEAEGYKVLAAGDGPEALLIAREHAGPIHLMMTDLVMPQMSGRELTKHFGLLRPAAKVLYVSGYTDDAVTRHDVHESQVAFLSKPFGSEALCRKVRTILDGAGIPV
jgi:PAS domain S-box-containing protein